MASGSLEKRVYFDQSRDGDSWSRGKINSDGLGEFFFFLSVEFEFSEKYCFCQWSLVDETNISAVSSLTNESLLFKV